VRLVDSSGWVQHLMDGPLADVYAEHLAADDLLVPTVVLYEVCKFMHREVSADAAASVASRMKEARVVPLDEQLALEAAEASLQHGLAMADAIVYATARAFEATLLTSDAEFRGLAGVEYLAPPTLPQ
jgi:predicted nucleic acid-binding protein